MPKSNRRLEAGVNAGSMADIAFMLLIFFLVTTTMDVDKGITVQLPPWADTPPEKDNVPARNIFMINLNASDELLVRGERAQVNELKSKCKDFILNPTNNPKMASAPNKAVIAIKNDRNSTYDAYIQVYDEIKSAYTEMWNDIALRDHGIAYSDDLSTQVKKSIRDQAPFVVSESESSNHAPVE